VLKTVGGCWKNLIAQLNKKFKTVGGWWKNLIAQLKKRAKKAEQPLMQSRIQVLTDLNALADVLEWFEQFNALPLTKEVWWQCQTALAEGFTNAVRHAHQNLPKTTPIEIEVTLLNHWFEVRIWDRGQPFDLHLKLKSISQETYNPLERTSGRGIVFMDQLTDDLDYTRTEDGRNCLLLRKKLVE
jgi:serine/threonine-protein kinase RsbW